MSKSADQERLSDLTPEQRAAVTAVQLLRLRRASKVVDVLTVLDRQLEFTVASDYSGASDDHRDLLAARAAVADLIEAAKLAKREVETVCRIEGGDLEYGSAVKLGKAASSLHTALARIGGAS